MRKLLITNYQLLIKTIVLMLLLVVVVPAVIFAADMTQTAQPEAATVTAAPAATEGVKTLTYNDCYNMAAENNRDYKIAKLDKAIAEAKLSKAAAGFGPTISIGGGYEPIYKGVFEIPANALYPGSAAVGGQSYYTARISLKQPVFTFGKTVFGFKIAEELYKIGQISFKQAGEKLKLDVISAFYGALISQELSKAQDEAMKASEEYLRITKTKYKNGQASNFDVLQAQVQYSNSIPDAQKASDGAKLAIQGLKNTLGLPMDQEIILSGSPEYKKMEMAYVDIKKKFNDKNDDREMIEASANIDGLTRNIQVAMLLPDIFLSLNYTLASASRDFSLKGENWSKSWDGTVGFQWNFFDGFKNVAAIKEAQAGAEKAEINKENKNNMLEIQLDQIYTSMEQSSKVIEAADEVIKQANEGYRIAKESYKNGLIQSVELLNAETGLLRAKMNYLNAMLNYMTTVEKLKNFID